MSAHFGGCRSAVCRALFVWSLCLSCGEQTAVSYKAVCPSSVRGWCAPILVGRMTYIGRWYVPILVTMRTYIGQPADQYRLLSRVKQYWSAIGPVLVTHSKQYWSRREVVLVTSPTSTGRKIDLVEGCRTDSCEGLIIYGRLSFPLHSISTSVLHAGGRVLSIN